MVDVPIFEIIKPCKKFDLSDQKKPGIPGTAPNSPYLGKYVVTYPVDPPGLEEASPQYFNIDFTGSPGSASALYYSTVFHIPKLGYHLVEADEWIEVSPTHRPYYEQTLSQRQALEATIKSGLASAAQAVADYELVKHDMRKYREFMNYLEAVEKAKMESDPKKREKKLIEAEHVLKSIFVDQVDVHNGATSMIQMAVRWPTLISDFMRITDEDRSVEAIMKKLNISRAEAVVLKTKNELFLEWKKMFSENVKERYELLRGMVEARKKSVDEYRRWLKPYIARYQMMKTGSSIKAVRNSIFESFADITGQATFANHIRLWAWKPLKTEESRSYPIEATDKFIINPYDDFIREKLIMNPKTGLAALYPWLLEKENGKYKADIIVEKEILPEWTSRSNGLDPYSLYYVFLDFNIMRYGTRLPVGEVEDITFLVKASVMSQNILLVKILELKCRQKELDRYIEEILGIGKEEKPITEIVKKEYPGLFGIKSSTKKSGILEDWKSIGKEISGVLEPVKVSLSKTGPRFFKPGPYESSFKDRLTKTYMPVSGAELGGIKKFILSQMGL